MKNPAVTMAVCYIHPASAKTENKIAVGSALGPGAFAAVYPFLSSFSQSISQLADEDSPSRNHHRHLRNWKVCWFSLVKLNLLTCTQNPNPYTEFPQYFRDNI